MATKFTGAGLPMTEDGLHSGCDKLGVQPAEVWSVLSVETHGAGFFPDRRPKILFERHIFHKQTNGAYDQVAPDLSNPVQGGYSGGTAEYDRLERAMQLDETAALNSASWGIGQIMGFNSKAAGYPDVATMVTAMVNSEDAQVGALFAFLKSKSLDAPMRSHDWDTFAHGYNGPNYVENQYNTKLDEAYQKYANGPLPDLTLRAAQLYLTYLGLGPVGIDGILGDKTRVALQKFQQSQGLNQTGQVDDPTWAKLQEQAEAAAAATP